MKKLTFSIFRITTTNLLIGLCIAVLLYKGYKHFYPDIPGYCYSQKRFIRDEEFIEIAVRRTLTDGEYRPDIDGSDESIRDFYKYKPDCCHVYRINAGKEPEGAAWSDKWHANVIMRFKPIKKLKSSEPDMYITITNIDVCGHVLDHHGTDG